MTSTVRSLVADAYHRAAPDFARRANRLVYSLLAKPLVDAVAAAVGNERRPVLDIAAGTGAFGSAFPRVVALDIARGQLEHNPAGCRVLGNASTLPFGDRAFAAAGCSFGINHLPHPYPAVAEMARVAHVVGLSTWLRSDGTYEPKRVVNDVLVRHLGRSRSPAGELVDRLGDQVGSVEAGRDLLTAAALDARVTVVEVRVPWPAADAYLE